MSEKTDKDIQKLQELTEGIDFCMLTTIDDGRLRCRPMSTQQFELDGSLWFFTSEDTHKADEIKKDNRVNVAYAKPDASTYVTCSGTAEIVHDDAKMKELWSPILKAWFPRGLDDPTICLLKVSVEQAEYWESTSGAVGQLIGFMKAIVTGQSAEWGDNKKIEM